MDKEVKVDINPENQEGWTRHEDGSISIELPADVSAQLIKDMENAVPISDPDAPVGPMSEEELEQTQKEVFNNAMQDMFGHSVEEQPTVDEKFLKLEAETHLTTREKLVRALKELGAPVWMVLNADTGKYDFNGRRQLIKDLVKKGFVTFAEAIQNGAFQHSVADIENLLRKQGYVIPERAPEPHPALETIPTEGGEPKPEGE